MEKELEDIKEKIEEFMKKYNCSVRVETISTGYTMDGKLRGGKVKILVDY